MSNKKYMQVHNIRAIYALNLNPGTCDQMAHMHFEKQQDNTIVTIEVECLNILWYKEACFNGNKENRFMKIR